MARLLTVGYEVEAPGNAVLGPENPNAGATVGTLARDTTHQRSGAGCLSCVSATGNAVNQVLFTPAASKTYFMRAYIRLSALPSSTMGIFGTSVLVGNGVNVRVSSAGKLELWNVVNGTQIGSDSAATMVANTYYRVELQIVLNASTQITSGELRLDGVTVATFSGLTLASGAITVGWGSTLSGSLTCYADDIAVNDSTGANNNTWPGPGNVVMLLPATDSASGAGWTKGNGTNIGTSGWDCVNNEPPTAIADLGGGVADQTQLRNATSNANSNYDANLTTYTAAGVGASDTVNALIPWVCTAAPVSTTAKAGTVGIVSNPAIANVNLGAGGTAGAFWSGVAGGTYPTGWKWSPGTITGAPTVTKGTSPVARITQVTSSTRIAVVCFLGMYVDYTPGFATYTPTISDTGLAFSDTLAMSTTALEWREDFEAGSIATIFNTNSGGLALDTAVFNTGAQSLKADSDSSGDPIWGRKILSNTPVMVFRCYLRVALKSGSPGVEFLSFATAAGQIARIGWDSAADKFGLMFAAFPPFPFLSNVTPVLGQWYRFDVRVDTSTGTWVVDWQIDGVAQPQGTSVQTATVCTDIYIAHPVSSAPGKFTVNFDTIGLSRTATAYPLGPPPANVYSPTISDTGLTVTDTLARGVVLGRTLTDTGLTVTDSVARVARRTLSDAGLSAPTTNFVGNPGFEVDTSGWGTYALSSFTRDTSTFNSGVASGKVTTDGVLTGGAGVFGQPAVPGPVYTFVVYARGAVGGEQVHVWLGFYDASSAQITSTYVPFTLATGWQRYVVTLVAPPLAVTVAAGTQQQFGASVISWYMDDAYLAALSDSLIAIKPRARADNGLVFSESLVRTATHPRTLADTGATVTDSVVAGKLKNVTVSDTGVTVAESLVRTAVHPRTATDTGSAVTESLVRTATHPRVVADTGATVTDSIAPTYIPGSTLYSRTLADTGLTAATDQFGSSTPLSLYYVEPATTYVRLHQATVIRSGTITTVSTYTDAPSGAASWRGVVYADSSGEPGALLGVSVPVTLTAGAPLAWSDASLSIPVTVGQKVWYGTWLQTGASTSYDTASSAPIRYGPVPYSPTSNPVDPWVPASSDVQFENHVLTVSVADSLVVSTARVFARTASDSGLAVTESIARTATHPRAVSDTGLTFSDALARTAVHPRAVADTGVTVTDSLVRTATHARVVTDTGATVTESLVRTATHPRAISDTGATISDTLVGTRISAGGYWPLNENPAIDGTAIADTSGSANPGVLHTSDGSTNKSVAGKIATSITFDGVDDYIDTNAHVFNGIGAGDFTITAWVYNTDQSTRDIVAGKDNYPSGRQVYFDLNTDYTGAIHAGMVAVMVFGPTDADGGGLDSVAGAVGPNAWHLVVWRRLGGVQSIWVDGIQVSATARSTGTGTAGLTIQDTSASFWIGGRQYPGFQDFFTGNLDEVGVYTRALSDTEIAALASAGAVTYNRTATDTGLAFTESLARTATHARVAADTGVTVADAIARLVGIGKAIADVGAAVSDTLAKTVRLGKAVSDVGATITDSLTRQTSRALTDQGLTLSDAVARTATHPRTASDQGVTVTDSLVRTAVFPRAVADTGAVVTDSLVRSAALVARTTADTGLTVTDALARTATHPRVAADTGLVVTDAVLRSTMTFGRPVADTVITFSDSILRTGVPPRTMADTGLAFADSLARGTTTQSRALADTGATVADSLLRSLVRRLTDTGATVTDTTASLRTRPLSDTGLLVIDATGDTRFRGLTDSGLVVTDSILRNQRVSRPLADIGVAFSDSLLRQAAGITYLADQGLTFSDSLARVGAVVARTVADTGLTLADSLVRSAASRARTATDTGLTVSDSLARTQSLGRALSDTGLVVTDSLLRIGAVVPRAFADTGLTLTDSLRRQQVGRALTDTGLSISDAAPITARHVLTDTGLAISDSLAGGKQYSRTVADAGLVLSDSLRRTALGRALADTGAQVTDSTAVTRLFKRDLTDSVSISDTVARVTGTVITVFDTAVTMTDSVALTRTRARQVADTGITVSDSLTYTRTTGATVFVTDIGVTVGDATRISVGRPLTDTGVSFSELLFRPTGFLSFLIDTGLTLSDRMAKGIGRVVFDTATTMVDSAEAVRSLDLSGPLTIQFDSTGTSLVLDPSATIALDRSDTTAVVDESDTSPAMDVGRTEVLVS